MSPFQTLKIRQIHLFLHCLFLFIQFLLNFLYFPCTLFIVHDDGTTIETLIDQLTAFRNDIQRPHYWWHRFANKSVLKRIYSLVDHLLIDRTRYSRCHQIDIIYHDLGIGDIFPQLPQLFPSLHLHPLYTFHLQHRWRHAWNAENRVWFG